MSEKQWLDDLLRLLRRLEPTSLALLEGVTVQQDAQWCSALPDGATVVAGTRAFDPSGAQGWLIRLYAHEGHPRILYLGMREQPASSEPAVVLAVALCRLAWRLRESAPMPPGPPPPELRDAIHSLRNGMNSVLMSAAVMTSAPLPERLQTFAADLDRAVARSLQAMHELMALVSPE